VDYSNPSIDDIPLLIELMVSPDVVQYGMDTQKKAHDALILLCSQEGGVEGIVSVLRNDDPMLRGEAATVIGALVRGGYIDYDLEPLLVPSLVEALMDESDQVILMACSALGDIVLVEKSGPEEGEVSSDNPSGFPDDSLDEIVAVLIELLDNENPDIRVNAANVLNFIGPDADTSIMSLTLMLEDDDFLVRVAAAVALTRIDPNVLAVIPILIEGVKNGDEPFYHRYRPLTGWDDPGHVAGTAAQSLGLLGPVALDAVPYLTQLFVSSHGDVRIAVSEAIAAIDPQGENSVPLLIELLNHENPDVRMTAAHTLGLIGPYAFEALQPLEEMLEDPVEPVMEVRGEIRTAIDKIGSSSPVTH
jgi:hypothetical protein